MTRFSEKMFIATKVAILKEVNFGKIKLWAVEHFWTDFDLRFRRDGTDNKISGKKRTNKLEKLARQLKLNRIS